MGWKMGIAMNGEPTVEVSILVVEEDQDCCAIALEMDLRGYGDTIQEALVDLREHIEMQMAFCRENNTPEAIYHPSEQVYWDLFNNAPSQSDYQMDWNGQPRIPAKSADT
jgi:hypothetical protein